MNKHSAPGRRLIGITAAVIGLLVVCAGSVAAATTPPGDVSYSQSGTFAELYTDGCASNGDGSVTCEDRSISLFTGKMSDSASGVSHTNQLCVGVASYTVDETSGEFIGTPSFERGCLADLPSGTFRIDGRLTSATLADTTVHVVDEACDKFGCEPGAGRDIQVSASWTGFGPLRTSKAHLSSDDGICRSREAFKGSSRAATISGSIDGQPISSADGAGQLSSGKDSFTSRCSEV